MKRTDTRLIKLTDVVNDTHEIHAFIHHSVHPADDIQLIIKNHEALINDNRVKIELLYDSYVPTKIASYTSDSIPFQTIANSALDIYPNAKVVPGMLVVPGGAGYTDSGRHYWNLTDNIYRFSPILMGPQDMDRYHGINERISVTNYNQVNLSYTLDPSVNIKSRIPKCDG